MAWDHLSIDKPHLVYIILGGFTGLFMLCSSVIKERLYIGEATVATLCGIIFGPHAANLIDPSTWGNTDQITLEFSRIVLVVQCFAVGVELPKAYMERHWRSVVFLLVPVMTFGWLVTSLFIWAMFSSHLSWLDSLTCAACVTATDPVLASSVVGKGKFAKRVPKHLRDLLSAESGCNDGMAFPFIYLALYIVRYRPDGGKVALHWFCITILYECIFGAIYGVLVGYLARRAIRYAHEKDLIDRESFLVFYFVLALFCAGSGSLLGMDDLLIGFACGVGFSNDGWFTEKTEETHVSNVIDLLLNLAFFVYFGTIIPWTQFNYPEIGTTAWRLVVVAFLVLFFRRIPIMLALKPVIPDIKLWREALFAGHFGPIGVGAIFVAILARADLETGGATPLAALPKPGTNADLNIIQLIWPITTFLVLTSIIVHGSSIAVFTLGKHINTLTITMSYTQGTEEMSWMDRLPRIQSRSKSSMSLQKPNASQDQLPYPQAMLGLPRNFLRRQREEDPESRASSRPPSRRRWSDRGFGAGGPISQSAIAPQPRKEESMNTSDNDKSESDTLAFSAETSPDNKNSSPVVSEGSYERNAEISQDPFKATEEKEKVYLEGDATVFEDEDGSVLKVVNSRGETEQLQRNYRPEHAASDQSQGKNRENHSPDSETEDNEKGELSDQYKDGGRADVMEGLGSAENRDQKGQKKTGEARMAMRQRMSSLTSWKYPFSGNNSAENRAPEVKPDPQRRGPARAFRMGRTIIVEDEDGEVIKKYDIPAPGRTERKVSTIQNPMDSEKVRERLQRVGTWLGQTAGASANSESQDGERSKGEETNEDDEDDGIRFTVGGSSKRMTKAEFIRQIQNLDPKQRSKIVEEAGLPDQVKGKARREVAAMAQQERRASQAVADAGHANLERKHSTQEDHHQQQQQQYTAGDAELLSGGTLANRNEIPFHSISADIRRFDHTGPETAAQRRRRLALQGQPRPEEDSDDDGTERVPPAQRRESLIRRLNIPVTPLSRLVSPGDSSADGANDRARRTDNAGNHADGDGHDDNDVETAAERRRREAALGVSKEDSDSDEDQSRPRERGRRSVKFTGGSSTNTTTTTSARNEQQQQSDSPLRQQAPPLSPSGARSMGIRFADQPSRPSSVAGAATTTSTSNQGGAGGTSTTATSSSWRAAAANRRNH